MTRLKSYVSNPVEPGGDEPQPFVALEHIESGTGRLLPGTELPEKSDETAIAHQAGDVRFGKLRPYLAKSLLMETPGIGSGELLVLRPRPEALDSRFLWYLTLSKPFLEWAEVSSYGVKMPRTNWTLLGAWDAWIPPLDEQRHIAVFLDTETGRIDELIAEQERLLALTAEHPSTAIDCEIWSDTGRTISLCRLTPQDRPIMYGIVLPGPNVDEGVLLVKGGDVKPGRLDPDTLARTTYEIEASYARARLRSGDIIYAIRGSIGDAELVPAAIEGANITQDVARIAPDSGVLPKWLLYAVKSRRFFAQMEAEARGATIRGINIWSLKRGQVPHVPIDTQQRSVDVLDLLSARVEETVREVECQVALLREHRQALITAAITGQLDLTRSAA